MDWTQNAWPLHLIVIAPVLEERLFRGFLLPLLIKHGLSIWGAALLTALLFALWHHFPGAEPFSWPAAISRMALGMICAIPVVWFRAFWPCAWLHGGWNLLVWQYWA